MGGAAFFCNLRSAPDYNGPFQYIVPSPFDAVFSLNGGFIREGWTQESISSEEIGIEGRRHRETIVERDYGFLRSAGIFVSGSPVVLENGRVLWLISGLIGLIVIVRVIARCFKTSLKNILITQGRSGTRLFEKDCGFSFADYYHFL